MDFLSDLKGISDTFAAYDLEKRRIANNNNNANDTQPTRNNSALDSKIEAQVTSGGVMKSDKMLYIGGGVVGLLVLILVLKK